MFNYLQLFWRAKRTLRVRLTTWYIFLLGCTLLFFSSYLYLQLKYSLLSQTDTVLEITASEIVSNLIVDNTANQKEFAEQFKSIRQQLTNTGFSGRIIDSNGQVYYSFGDLTTINLKIPEKKVYLTLKTKTAIWRVYNLPLVIKSDRLKLDFAKAPKKTQQIWLQVAQSLQPVSKALDHLLFLMLFSLPIILFLAGLGGLFLADRALDPINRIIRIAETIHPEDFSRRINYQGVKDEVGRLAITFDRMLDRIESAFDHERRFIADASHELRTPLTVIKGRIGVALIRQRSVSEYENTLADLEKETDRLIRLTNGLLLLARLEQEELQGKGTFLEVDLSNLLEVLSEQMQPLATERKIILEATINSQLLLLGNCDLLTSLFLNLLDNAIKYTPTGGYVKLMAQQKQQQIQVKVSNTGLGIAQEHLPYVFERFYRIEGDRSRHTGGAGLGLAIAKLIVRCHGGQISVTSHTLLSHFQHQPLEFPQARQTSNTTEAAQSIGQINQLTIFEVILPGMV